MAGTPDWTNLGKQGTKHRVNVAFIHPENANDRSIDIALIQLENPIQFSKNVKSINLPDSDIEKPGLPVVVSGWGENNKASSLITLTQN